MPARILAKEGTRYLSRSSFNSDGRVVSVCVYVVCVVCVRMCVVCVRVWCVYVWCVYVCACVCVCVCVVCVCVYIKPRFKTFQPTKGDTVLNTWSPNFASYIKHNSVKAQLLYPTNKLVPIK